MTVYLKSYNSKLCRKGLLERGKSVGKLMGNFKDLETEFLVKAAQKNSDSQQLLQELKEKVSTSIEKELNTLKISIRGLSKTIENTKREAKSITNEASFQKWTEHTDDIAKKIKMFYSIEANNLYDHFYKMDGKFDQLISGIKRDTNLVYENVSTPLSKKKQDSLFMESSWVEENLWVGDIQIKKKKLDDSGFMSNDSGINDSGPNEYFTVDEIGEVDGTEFDEMIARMNENETTEFDETTED